MRRIDFYRVKRRDNLGDPEFWNPRFEDIDLRLAEAESAMRVIDETAARAESAALSRINDVLTPLAAEAQERLTRVATIFEATSSSEVTFGEGIRQFLIPQGQRLTFAPLAYLIAFPTGDLSRYLTGRFVSYSHTSGILQIDVMRAVGEGTESDWQITPMAFASELEALADDVTIKANAVAADKIAVATDRGLAVAARNQSVEAKGQAEAARDNAQGLYNQFSAAFRGALSADPIDGEVGHWYFNTAQQMARVRTAAGWAPLFSISLGGIRQDEVVATAGQTVIVAGDFTFMNVWRNGSKLRPGVDFTLASPNITLTSPATGGDVISYLGYYATDETDFYTKALSDARYYTKSQIDAAIYTKAEIDAEIYTKGQVDDAIETRQPASSTLTSWAAIAPATKANVTATNLKWQGSGYTVSTAAPSGGVDGDFWFRREA